MRIERIIGGYGSGRPSRAALAWAVREASMTGAVVHVVTAWKPPRGRPPAIAAVAARLRGRQVAAIRAALAGVGAGRRPVVTGEVVLADRVTALAAAADGADLVVIGSRAHDGDSFAGRLAEGLARWPRRFGGPCPVRVVRTLSTADIRLRIRSLDRVPQVASRSTT